jgi:CheY-like chemotaxis protein
MPSSVLVVDDRRSSRRALAAELEDAGFEVIQAEDGSDGWSRFCAHAPDLVITDMVMPNAHGVRSQWSCSRPTAASTRQ